MACAAAPLETLDVFASSVKRRFLFKSTHGVEWQPHNSSSPDEVSTLQRQSFYLSLPKEQVIDASIVALFEKVDELAAKMDTSMRKMLTRKCQKLQNALVMS